ncbi:MAG TPA: EamA family transporter [Candidatus Dormibacteraeota bacterium]
MRSLRERGRFEPPAPLFALGAIASVQVGATVARRLFDAIGPTSTVFLRVAFGALILLGLARPLRPRLTWSQWQSVLLFGITIAAMNFCFYQAIARIPLGIAVTIEFIGPLGVAVAGSRNALDFVWVLMAAVGVALLSLAGGSVTVAGLLFALGAAAGWATYIVLSQRVGRIVPGPDGLALALAIAAVALAPFGIVSAGVRLIDLRNLSLGLVVAVLSSAIPFSLEFAALRRLPRKVFGILMSLEPGMGAAAGFILLGQRLAIRDLAAIALVIAASIGATANANRQTPSPLAGERVG